MTTIHQPYPWPHRSRESACETGGPHEAVRRQFAPSKVSAELSSSLSSNRFANDIGWDEPLPWDFDPFAASPGIPVELADDLEAGS